MSSKVYPLEDYKPHFVINGESTHVIPQSFFTDIVSGKIVVSDPSLGSDMDDVFRVIIKEWLEFAHE